MKRNLNLIDIYEGTLVIGSIVMNKTLYYNQTVLDENKG